MSRRGDRVEEYDERTYYERDSAAPARSRTAPVRARDLLEIDINARRERDRDRQPEFIRQEYARVEEQPLVLKKREIETFTRPVQRRSPSPVERERVRTRYVERERNESPSPVERERVRTRVVERQRERSPSPVQFERVRTKVVERERERSPSPVQIERVRTKVVERERERSASPVQIERVRTKVVERERERSPEPERYRTRIVEKERDRSFSPPGERIRTRVVERDTERSRMREPSVERVRTTTRTVERERERERERSPSPVRERVRTRVVERERERERERSVSSESSRSLPLEQPIIRAPPIHQEVITHHRHIDHGFEYAQAPTPPPPLIRPRPKESETEIDIYKGRGETEIDIHTSKRGGREEAIDIREARHPREFYDDDVLIERDRERLHVREAHNSRRRSVSARRDQLVPYESEEDYYVRKTSERAYTGEAYNGNTRDWSIVDVPPGTERVRMDGVGGASQEITWQRYNGVRRSKFIPERDSLALYDREQVTDRRVALPPKNKFGDLWTEITKDLVVREAIEEIGYDYEETEYFFYIFQYLRYEDIQELVLISKDIRKARQSRIREIAIERERLRDREVVEIERRRERAPAYEEERFIERDIIYDDRPRPSRGFRESVTVRDYR